MKDTESFIDEGRGSNNKSSSSSESKKPEASTYRRFITWYKENSDSKLGRFIKFLISFGVAYSVRYLVYWLWFDHDVFFVNPFWDFSLKTMIIFVSAAGLLVVLDSAMKSEGKTTALALGLFLFISGAQHYAKNYYDADGNSKVFIDSQRGYIYSEEDATSFTDIKTTKSGKRYFIHPISGDTCWNDSPKKIIHNTAQDQRIPAYSSPSGSINYSVGGSPYTFKLEAGEVLDHWITFNESVHVELVSDNYDYIIVYSETEQYHGGTNTIMPDRSGTKFFLKGGDTEQTITMKVSYN